MLAAGKAHRFVWCLDESGMARKPLVHSLSKTDLPVTDVVADIGDHYRR